MAGISPTTSGPIPFNPALRAYGAAASRVPANPYAAPARAGQVADRVDLTGRASRLPTAPAAEAAPAIPQAPTPKIQGLVAARVPEGIDFSGSEPRPAMSALETAKAAARPAPQTPSVTGASLLMQLYRHPADKVQAATDVAVGRMLDRLA